MTDLSEFQDGEPRWQSNQPKGWEPSLEWKGTRGTLTTGPVEHEPTDAIWGNLIADWGLDPAQVRIVPGSVQVRAWDANCGGGEIKRLKYYRASLEPVIKTEDHADIDALCRLVEKRKPVKPTFVAGSQRAAIVNLSDWQIGKGEGGGTPAFVERMMVTIDRLQDHLKMLRKLGIEAVYLVGLGDLVEQCDGHYDMQAFSVDLDRREQMRLARRIILGFVDMVIGLGLRAVIGAVPGNHGENRRNGKAFTTWTDNDDLAVFDGIAEIISHNAERYALASIPQAVNPDDLTLTLDVAGVPVGWAHGHQCKSGGPEKWWSGQVMGHQPIGQAQILNTGHFHHLTISEKTGRTWMQMPANDGGSYWWTAQTGQASPAGTVCYVAGNSCGPRGWADLVVV